MEDEGIPKQAQGLDFVCIILSMPYINVYMRAHTHTHTHACTHACTLACTLTHTLQFLLVLTYVDFFAIFLF